MDRAQTTQALERARDAAPGGRRLSTTTIALALLAIGAVSALKGLAPVVDQTALYLYYTDYRFGFVPRGLLGQLFSPVLAITPPAAHRGLLFGWHLATLAALLAALSGLAARTVAATGRRVEVLAMAALLFCSPLIASLANSTAAPEVLLCLLTLGVLAAVRARRPALAWLLFLAGVLVHQLMVFLALPVMILAGAVEDGRRSTIAGSVAVGLAACASILLASAPDARFADRFIEHGIPPDAARSLLQSQLGQTTGFMLRFMAGIWRQNALNGLIGTAYSALAGAAILAACLLTPGAVRAAEAPLAPLPAGGPRTALAVLLVLGAGLSPLLVLAFALDLSRLGVLSTFTAFLAADILLRRGPPADDPPAAPARSARSTLAAALCGGLAAVFLCLPFVALWFTGALLKTQDLLLPHPLLRIEAAREVVDRFLAFYNRNPP